MGDALGTRPGPEARESTSDEAFTSCRRTCRQSYSETDIFRGRTCCKAKSEFAGRSGGRNRLCGPRTTTLSGHRKPTIGDEVKTGQGSDRRLRAAADVQAHRHE